MLGEYWQICTGLDSEKEVWNIQKQSIPLGQSFDPGASLGYA